MPHTETLRFVDRSTSDATNTETLLFSSFKLRRSINKFHHPPFSICFQPFHAHKLYRTNSNHFNLYKDRIAHAAHLGSGVIRSTPPGASERNNKESGNRSALSASSANSVNSASAEANQASSGFWSVVGSILFMDSSSTATGRRRGASANVFCYNHSTWLFVETSDWG